MDELKQYVSGKSTSYWNKTADAGQQIDKMPESIIDFVVEYFFNSSRFPRRYTDDKKAAIMRQYANAMAMACVEVYGKAGAEGQLSHSENSVSRGYEAAWISNKLIADLPNYVDFFN